MRRFLIVITAGFCLLLAASLMVEPDLNFHFQSHTNINGHSVSREMQFDSDSADGAAGVLGGVAGMALVLITLAFGLLLAVFAVFGVGLLMAGVFIGLGLVFVAMGMPFLAPLAVIGGLVWVIARKPKRADGTP
jgi:hypothetical protein